MKQLIKVEKQANRQVVNAKDLYEFLEVKSKFADWIKNHIRNFDFIENQDFVTFSKNLENGGRTKEYALSLNMAKELSMLARSKKGKQARQYFINCEHELAELKQKAIARSEARLENPEMTKALKEAREELGKETKAFNYANENNLIYRVVLGCTAKQWKNLQCTEESVRDSLTSIQIQAVQHIQKANTVMLDMGMNYETRKIQLNKIFNKKFAQKILDEFHKLEA